MDARQLWKPLVGWGLLIWSIIQALSFVLGLAGMPDDLKTWVTRWLPAAWKWMSDLPIGLSLVISLLLFAVGILVLARERFEPIPTSYRYAARLIRSRLWRRSRAESEESPPTTEGSSQTKEEPQNSSNDGELGEHEAAALQVVAQHVNEPDEGITPVEFRRKMAQRGFPGADGTLALASLRERGMLEKFEYEDWNGDSYWQYRLTLMGTRWLSANRPSETDDADIPF